MQKDLKLIKIYTQIIIFFVLFIIVFGVMVLAVYGDKHYPNYSNYVNDYTKTLSDDFINKQNQKLSDYDKQTSNQIAVALIDTTGDEEIEEYGIHLAEKWKPGQDGKDNGAILIIAKSDRKLRIEVGRGLEDDLTDVEAKHIIDDNIVPELKSGNFEAGIETGVDNIIESIKDNEEATSVSGGSGSDGVSSDDGLPWWVWVLIAIFPLGVIIWLMWSEHTPLGGEGDHTFRGLWVPQVGSSWGSSSFGTIKSSGSIGGVSFGGGSFSGGGASGSF